MRAGLAVHCKPWPMRIPGPASSDPARDHPPTASMYSIARYAAAQRSADAAQVALSVRPTAGAGPSICIVSGLRFGLGERDSLATHLLLDWLSG